MNKLLSTLFMEVTDIDEHQKKIDELIDVVQDKAEQVEQKTGTLATKVESNKEAIQDALRRASVIKTPQLSLDQAIDELKEEDEELSDHNLEKKEDVPQQPVVVKPDIVKPEVVEKVKEIIDEKNSLEDTTSN